MFVIEYIWIHDVKTSNIQSQTSIVAIPECVTLSNENVGSIPLLKLQNKHILRPVYVTNNPFSSCSNAYIALCEIYKGDDNTTDTNNRLHCDLTLTKHYKGTYTFDAEQHFSIDDPKFKVLKIDTRTLSVGNYFSNHREFTDRFLKLCLQMGITITNLSSKNLNQWVYRVSSVLGTETGDVVWITRYLLYRLSEQYQFQIKINNLVLTLNEISNNSKFNTDPYLTLSVMVSTIHTVKSRQDMDRIATSTKLDTISEQIRLKNEIMEETEILQLHLEETYNLAQLEQQELKQLEELNRMKEHQQHINKIRQETRVAEEERLERESRIQIELMKRQEREEQERLVLALEEDEMSKLENRLRIEDAELSRIRLIKEETDMKESKTKLHNDLVRLMRERDEIKHLEEEEKQKENERLQAVEIARQEKELQELEEQIETENNRQKTVS